MDENAYQGILTPRALEVLATCPARFHLEQVRGLRRFAARPASASDARRDGLAFALGQRWGALLQRSWWLPEVRERFPAEAHAGRDAHAALAEWGRRATVPAAELEACRAILRHYATQHPADADAELAQRTVQRRARRAGEPTFAANELIFAPLPYQLLGDRVRLRVRLPLLWAARKAAPQLVLLHATSTSSPAEVAKDRRLDRRGLAAAWAAWRWSRRAPELLTWDVVRTTPPREPGLLRCAKCHGKGTVPGITPGEVPCVPCAGTGVIGISRAACDTTAGIWEAVAARHPHLDAAAERAAAAELLARLTARGEAFAYRVAVPVTEAQILEWLADLRALFAAANAWGRRGRWPRNPAACMGRGAPCPYRAYCLGTALEDETHYFQRVASPAAWDEVTA
jgi:hypothetical protein